MAGKLTIKPAPEDPNELLARREEQKRRMLEQDKIRELKRQRIEQAKARHKVDMEREDRAPEIAAIEEDTTVLKYPPEIKKVLDDLIILI